MKNTGFVTMFLMTIITCMSIVQSTEAQARRRARVARHNVRVVHTARHQVVVRKAQIRYAHLPRWGTSVAVLPAAAVPVRSHNQVYHFHKGVYYAPRNNNFVVVRPVIGMRIRVLPVGYRTVVVSNRNYYYYYGSFYSKADKADEYEVTNAPIGAVVDALPDGYEVRKVGDMEYYVLDGVYYAEVDAEEFEDGVGYEVVKI
jgi:hypothetical protein